MLQWDFQADPVSALLSSHGSTAAPLMLEQETRHCQWHGRKPEAASIALEPVIPNPKLDETEKSQAVSCGIVETSKMSLILYPSAPYLASSNPSLLKTKQNP